MTQPTRRHLREAPRYVALGLLTVAPLWITWLIFQFVLALLSRAGMPWVNALARASRGVAPGLADWLGETWFQSLLAALVTLVLLYLLGWTASRVLGQRIIGTLERLVQRVPVVAAIYGAAKKFLDLMRERPAGAERVVLVNFPSSDMKTLAFVTRVVEDEASGRKLAIVYVPTAPNPTSGYVEIVPLDLVTPTDFTMDQAMSFVVTAGTSAPAKMPFGPPPPADPAASSPPPG